MNGKRKKQVVLIIIATLLVLGLLGASYAFFTANLSGRETRETITVAGGEMNISYQGGANIFLNNIIPDYKPAASKNFTVVGTNTTRDVMIFYTMTLVVTDNTFSDNAITYQLTSENTSGKGSIVPSSGEQIGISTGNNLFILGDGIFNQGNDIVHTYKLDIFFPETGENQNADQGKVFKAHISIEEPDPGITRVVFLKNGATSISRMFDSCELDANPNGCSFVAPEISRDDFMIVGWSTNPDATTSELDVNAESVYTSNQVYYAITRKDVTINFELNGATAIGAASLSCSYYNTADACELIAPTIERPGYDATGWNLNSSATISTWNIGTAMSHSADNTYYAITKLPNLKTLILNNNTLRPGSPDFTKTSWRNSAHDGFWSASDNYGTSYYFRGHRDVLNNNVIFGGFQWKIIRITGSGDIRLIYNGECTSTPCTINTTGTATQVSANTMFSSGGYQNSLGYMYGTHSTTSYEVNHANINNSIAKNTVDTWYNTKLSATAKSLVADSIYCADRSVTSGTGIGSTYTWYGSYSRLVGAKAPSLVCPQINDRFTVSDAVGNQKLTYPVGMITGDEVAMAGGLYVTASEPSNNSFYLYNAAYNWTMSPDSFGYASNSNPFVMQLDGAGRLSNAIPNTPYGIRPVITLKSTVEIKSGNGSAAAPYIILE